MFERGLKPTDFISKGEPAEASEKKQHTAATPYPINSSTRRCASREPSRKGVVGTRDRPTKAAIKRTRDLLEARADSAPGAVEKKVMEKSRARGAEKGVVATPVQTANSKKRTLWVGGGNAPDGLELCDWGKHTASGNFLGV